MIAVTAEPRSKQDPLAGLSVRDWPEPAARQGWVPVTVRAAALNHHDLWFLRGRIRSSLEGPVVLGTDAAGVDDEGNEVVIHAVIADPDRGRGDETLDPQRAVLSDAGHGTMAERILVPKRNCLPKPDHLSWEEAATLPTAWLTAYRMLFTKANAQPGQRLLVQGAGGGVATAVVQLAKAAGLWVRVTSRDPGRREEVLSLGADETVPTGTRLPADCDIVIETVGPATWRSSLRAVRPGGTVVLCGATTGFTAETDLALLFSRQVTVRGSTMGTLAELRGLLDFIAVAGLHPRVGATAPLARAGDLFGLLAEGRVFGKAVLVP